MRKNDDIYNLLDGSVHEKMDQEEIKFTLFLKSRELSQISAALHRVMLKDKEERQQWVEDNQQMIEALMKVFAEDSSLSIEGMQLDEETAALSMELAGNLKKTISLINSLFYGVEDLKS